MSRRPAITSATGAVAVMAKASREIVPPAHIPLDVSDMPFWDAVIAEMARSEWSPHQLEMAAILARTMADLASEQAEMRREGSVCDGEINPRKQLIAMHTQSIMALRRSLSIHGRAQRGEARDIGKARGYARGIEAVNPLNDDLLARPADLN